LLQGSVGFLLDVAYFLKLFVFIAAQLACQIFALHGLAHARLRCAHGFASSKILSFFAIKIRCVIFSSLFAKVGILRFT